MQTVINKAGNPVAVAGQLSDNGEGVDIVSRFSEESSAELAFGTAIKPGTALRSVKKLTAITETVEGFSVWGFNHSPGSSGDLGTTGLKPKAGLQVIRKGRLYVVVDPSVTSITPYIDRAHIRAVANGGDNVIGAVNKAADGITTIDSTKQVQFVGALMLAADGVTKIAEVEVNFTNEP